MKFICAVAVGLSMVLLYLLVDPEQQPAGITPPQGAGGGVIRVAALLCDASAEQWEGLLASTSSAIVDAGGVPLVNVGTRRGCPASNREAQAAEFVSADILVVADGTPDRQIVRVACRSETAAGCAPQSGNAIFLGDLNASYARIALAHELGHKFGLDHSPDGSDVMFARARPSAALGGEYLAAMRQFAGASAPSEHGGNVATIRPAPTGSGESCSIPVPEFFPSPLPMPPSLPERVPGHNLPTFATEEGGRALTDAEMQQWGAARAADPAYQDAVRRMQDRRRALASRGMLTAFDSGRCTLAQSAEKCREARAILDAENEQWARDTRAAKERGEP